MYDFFLDLFTNVVCVSYVRSSPICDGVLFAHVLFSYFVLGLFTHAVCVSWVHHSSFYDGVRFAHLFSFLLTCSAMLSVFREFTPPKCLLGSVLLICLVCSWLVHQCCMCLLSSPLPSVCLDPCCLSV